MRMYCELEKVKDDCCLLDMFIQIQMHHHRALDTAAASKKHVLDRLPDKSLEQMHTIDLTGKSNLEIIDIITRAGRTSEKWDEAKKSLGLKKSSLGIQEKVII